MKDGLISTDERAALITAIGIILGFALAFFTSWSLKDPAPEIPVVLVAQDVETAQEMKKSIDDASSSLNPWDPQDLPPLAAILIGIGILMRALFRSLTPPDQTVEYYNHTIRIFMWGIVVTFVTAAISIFV